MQYRILRPLSSCDYIMTFTTNEHNSRATVDYGNGISLSGKCHIVCQARRDNLINIDSRLIIGKHWRGVRNKEANGAKEKEKGERSREKWRNIPENYSNRIRTPRFRCSGSSARRGQGSALLLRVFVFGFRDVKHKSPREQEFPPIFSSISLSTRPTDRLRTDFRLN